MKRYIKNIYRIAGLVVLWAFCAASVQAQTNLTRMLGMTNSDYISIHNGGGTTHAFNAVRNALGPNQYDLFILTATFESGDFPSVPVGGKIAVYRFKLDNTIVYEVGATNTGGNLFWYVSRPTGVSPLTKSIDLDYVVYEDLGVNGDFSFIFTKYFTGIAVDDGGTNVKFAPLFFGMESNAGGTFTSHAGEFMGLTNNVSNRRVYMLKQTKAWRMSGSHKIGALDALFRLGSVLDKISNTTGGASDPGARVAEENAVFDEFIVEDLTTVVNIYPNPSFGQFQLDFHMKESGEVKYQILDIGGRLISQAKAFFEEGNQQWSINESGNLSTGIYTIKFAGPDLIESRRLIVK
jgi:hypothetical protein